MGGAGHESSIETCTESVMRVMMASALFRL
jgi:hypothetical protein